MKYLFLPTLALPLVISISAQVREITLGIDINCRSGLSECYVMVGKGLDRLDGVSAIAERPSNSMRTCVIQTHEGRFLEPLAVADQLQSLQIGARLRAMEAIVDGRVEAQGNQLLLRIPGKADERVVLGPLTEKVQWDEQRDSPQKMTATERRSHTELLKRARLGPLPVRVTGPLRQDTKHSALRIEIRDFEVHPDLQSEELALLIVLDRKTGETSLASLLEQLRRLTWADFVSESIGETKMASAVEVRVRRGHFPEEHEIKKLVRICVPGARIADLQLRGASAFYLAGRQPVVKASPVPNAWHELEIAGTRSIIPVAHFNEPQLMQWSGSLKKSFRGQWRLEVDSLRKVQSSEARIPPSQRPQPPLLQASTRDGRRVKFEWFNSAEANSSYNIYRMDPSGAWLKINREPLSSTSWDAEVPLDAWYAVTGLSPSGHESTYSKPISAQPPEPPGNLRLRANAEFPQLSWAPNTERDFSSYNIYRSSRPSGPYTQISVGVTQTSYSDPFTRDRASYYVVTATDTSGNQSVFSQEVEFRPSKQLAHN